LLSLDPLWLASRDRDSELDILDVLASIQLAEPVKDLRAKPVKLLLPNGVFYFNHQRGPNKFDTRRMLCNGLADGGRPNGARQIVVRQNLTREFAVSNEPRGTFHRLELQCSTEEPVALIRFHPIPHESPRLCGGSICLLLHAIRPRS
jgi:hypothetical protein